MAASRIIALRSRSSDAFWDRPGDKKRLFQGAKGHVDSAAPPHPEGECA